MRAVHRCVGAVLLGLMLAGPAHAAAPPAAGTYALPDGTPKVSATLAVTPGAGREAGLSVLDVAMAGLGNARPLTRYDIELSKRLHVIAVSDDFRVFLHGHAERPGADGHFRVPIRFPGRGAWHIYADAVPSGLGQQVMRFDVNLDPDGTPAAAQPATPQPTGLAGRDGRYGVRFDALDLRAGQEAQLTLHLLRDDKPAPDLAPYLGVAAHAVLISAADLVYVHAHAAPAATAGAATGAAHGHDMAGMAGMAAASPPGARAADLVLHVTAPKAGTYLLWLQFSAGGRVRTVPFVVAVA